MKQNGIFGKGTGKLGSSVFAISGGVQIVREYNPNVSNPNTDAQINQRAKFKLMSQIAADLASVIVISKDGLTSARNKFVSKNIGLVEAINGEASVNYVALQLTASDSAFPTVNGSIDGQGNLGVELAKMPAADIQKVVYCAFAKDDTNQLSLIGTTIIDRNGATNNFAATFANAADAYVVYAYGIKASAIAANPNYDNYVIEGATDIARLVASRSISLDASGTTRTSGVLVAAGSVQITSVHYEDPSDGREQSFGPASVAGPVTLREGVLITGYVNNVEQFDAVTGATLRLLNDGIETSQSLPIEEGDIGGITFRYPDAATVENAYIVGLAFTDGTKVATISFQRP